MLFPSAAKTTTNPDIRQVFSNPAHQGLKLYTTMKTHLNHSFDGLLASKKRNPLTVHLGCKVLLLEAHEITYLQGDGNYTYVYTAQGKRYLVSKTMKAILNILNAGFLRIHKSYTINPIHLVARIETDRVLLSGGKQLPIARRRIVEMQEQMAGQYLRVG
jgi:two-component system LytT family response regulator